MAEIRNQSNETRNQSNETRNQSNETRGQNPQAVQRQSPRSELARQRDWSSNELASPFTFMRRFMTDIDRLFGDFGFGPSTSGLSQRFESSLPTSAWSPQIDISEREGQLMIHADLPGLKQDDIRVNVEGDTLTISGERSDQHEQNQGGVHRRERSYGSFMRRIALPENVDPESIKASFENGVLEISMPSPRRGSQGRTIPIQNKSTGGTQGGAQGGSQGGTPPNISH